MAVNTVNKTFKNKLKPFNVAIIPAACGKDTRLRKTLYNKHYRQPDVHHLGRGNIGTILLTFLLF